MTVNIKKLLLSTTGLVLLGLASSLPAQGQDVGKTVPQLEKLVSEVREINSQKTNVGLRKSYAEPVTTEDRKLHQTTTDFFTSIYRSDQSALMATAKEIRVQYNTSQQQNTRFALETMLAFADLALDEDLSKITQTALDAYVENVKTNRDWYSLYLANNAASSLSASKAKRSQALEYAQTALSAIPHTQGYKETEARVRIYSQIAHLHNIQRNPTLAVEVELKRLGLLTEESYPGDFADIFSNLIFGFIAIRDLESAEYLAATLVETRGQLDESVPGLIELRLARLAVELREYDKAENYAKQTIEKSEIKDLQKFGYEILSTTYAAKGQENRAIENLKLAGLDADIASPVLDIPPRALRTLGLLALNANDADRANAIFDRRLNEEVRKIVTDINADTTALLASLENSRERQAEREEAADRELGLREVTIAKQRALNRMLLLLSLLMAMGAISAIAFARYRDRISKALAIKTEEAESADRMKSEFLGMISHELRTPLNGIIGISDMLANTHPDPDIRHKTGIVLKSGNDLFRVVERIIDMSRIEGGKLELFPDTTHMADLIRSASKTHEAEAIEKGLTYTAHIGTELEHHVSCDPEKVEQCLRHVLENAVRFTDTGRIHLHATGTPSDGRMQLNIVVADTGMGMTEDVQSRLFTPFLQADTTMTRKFGGSGLSLAITREMARMMDGEISVVSRSGRGSEFTLILKFPLAEPVIEPDANAATVRSMEPVQPAAPVTDPEQQVEILDLMAADVLHMAPEISSNTLNSLPDTMDGLRVLVVEDVASNRDILRLLLEPVGCVVTECESGRAALDTLERQGADIILLDIHMPGMDGIETARRIRAASHRWANVPIIALTADAAAEVNAACMAAGADVFLTKPVMRQELLESISFIRRTQLRAGTTPGLLRA